MGVSSCGEVKGEIRKFEVHAAGDPFGMTWAVEEIRVTEGDMFCAGLDEFANLLQ